MKKLTVIGSGVIGLTTALVAQEKGYTVTIYTADDPLKTTSTKAAASFKPTEVAYNDLAHTMTKLSWEDYAVILKSQASAAGVRLHTHWEAFSIQREEARYLTLMKNVEIAKRPNVPGGYAFGWKYITYFIDTSVYIPWLIRRFKKQGGKIIALRKSLKTFIELCDLPTDIIINCTGMGAKQLCNDQKLIPVRGQIAIIDKLKMDWSINADGFYIYPRKSDTVLGGTYEWNVSKEEVEHGALYLILKGNLRAFPELATVKIKKSYAGIRPYRLETIRVEREDIAGKRVIHNYGHGGAGVTLSWGSARLAQALI